MSNQFAGKWVEFGGSTSAPIEYGRPASIDDKFDIEVVQTVGDLKVYQVYHWNPTRTGKPKEVCFFHQLKDEDPFNYVEFDNGNFVFYRTLTITSDERNPIVLLVRGLRVNDVSSPINASDLASLNNNSQGFDVWRCKP